MKKSRVSHDSTTHQHEHDQGSEVMLSKPLTSRQQLPPTYLNASTGTAISSVNGTLVVHVKADAYNYNSIISNGGVSTSGDNNNTTTISYEQLQQEFYQSYDPSIGLHTAAVLGGILVWLVLYVIYRTKIRKWIIGLVKKKFGTHDELDNKSSDSEKDSNSGTNPNMVRPLINPSIVIEGSPPESLPQSPTTYDQYPKHGMNECMSPYSLTGAGMNEDGMVFQFPGHLGSQQQLHLYHQQCCPDQHEIYLQLPRSEMDIPSATAQWVQNMPLAARSHQDFAGLMLSMQSHGMLSLHKPCSCPMVCPRSPQPLPLLDLPNSWNKSLPVLSNSISSQLLSAYDRVSSSQNTGKDVKDIINAKRKMNRRKRHDNRDREGEECDELIKKTEIGKEDIEKWKGQTDVGNQTGNNKKKSAKTPPHLTIKIPDSKDNATLISNSSFTRSPVPIPVTPTVMIQNSKPVSRRHHGYDSNTSMSSSSSIDFLLAPPLASPRHMSKPGSPHMIPSPHLLSPTCEGRKHSGSSNNTFTWNREDIKRYHDGKDLRRSGSVSPHLCRLSHHQCSFKKKKNINTGTKNIGHQHLDKTLRRHNSLGESHLPQLPSVMSTVPPLSPQIHQHRRSFSDYHARFQRDFLTSSPSSQSSQSRGHHQRSLSADVAFSINLQREQGSPTYSNESNKNSLGTSSYSHSPSPNLLRVPDSGNFRAMTPDFGTNNNNNHGMYSSDNPPSMRHCVHSDSNIAYYAGQLLQVGPHEDGGLVRRHSTYVPGSGEINLSFCGDNIVRASSSYGSSSSYNSSHHHSHHHHHHSHLPTHAHHHSHHHRDQQRHRHQPHHHQHQHHQLHHSTGMLAVDTPDNRQRASCSPHNLQSNLNRSFSAVVMETKL